MRLETQRLVLRRWRRDDAPHLTEILSHHDVASTLGDASPRDVAATIERYRRHWDVHGFGRWAVEDRLTGQLVGRVGLMRQEEWTLTPENVEVGWTIDRSRWGEGLATEAALTAIADGFERVRLERVLSWTLPHNVASRRVMEKCGLTLQRQVPFRGVECVCYAIDGGIPGIDRI
jgi:RimJ/RimL family protein N-acetyltransferase